MRSCIRRITTNSKLTVPWAVWKDLIRDLRRKGDRRRESGAFLLGRANTKKIVSYLCYDELDPGCYDTKIIRFNQEGYRLLWEHCSLLGLQVIADVHTHPSYRCDQSIADQENPMIVTRGHLAIIVPNYAGGNERSLKGIGFYEYLGEFSWKKIFKHSKALKIV